MSDRDNDQLARLRTFLESGEGAHGISRDDALAAVVEVREQLRQAQSKAEEGGGKAAVSGEGDCLSRVRDDVLWELRSAKNSAAGTARVLQGIPVFLATWSVLDGIARKLARAEQLMEADRG